MQKALHGLGGPGLALTLALPFALAGTGVASAQDTVKIGVILSFWTVCRHRRPAR